MEYANEVANSSMCESNNTPMTVKIREESPGKLSRDLSIDY